MFSIFTVLLLVVESLIDSKNSLRYLFQRLLYSSMHLITKIHVYINIFANCGTEGIPKALESVIAVELTVLSINCQQLYL